MVYFFHSFIWRIVILLGLVIMAVSCDKKPVDIPPDPLLLEGDVEIVRNVVIYYSDSMRIKARVEGPKLVKYLQRENERDEFPDGVLVTFFDDLGNQTSSLKANFGVRQPRTKQIKAIGNVIFDNVDGEVLESEEMIWSEEEDKVFTRKFVMITTPDEKVWGMGFEANQAFTRRRIYAPEGRVSIAAPPE